MESTKDFDEKLFDEELKIKAGMVRASFGLYTTTDDVNALVSALKDIVAKRDEYEKLYQLSSDGDYVHKTFKPQTDKLFSIESFVTQYLK